MNSPATVMVAGLAFLIPPGGDCNAGRLIIEWPKDRVFCFHGREFYMDRLTIFGLFAVTAMLVCYALEDRSRWFVLGFAAACLLGSAYGFLQGAWPFGIIEAIWSLVAARRWWQKTISRRFTTSRKVATGG